MLTGKVCVVTGAAKGIGRACALEMADRRAAAVVACDLDAEGAQETAAEVGARGSEGIALACDVTDGVRVANVMDEVGRRFGRIDVLHNNAGILEGQFTQDAAVDTLTEEVWDRLFAVNVKGTWLCTKYATPWLRRSEAAAIVNAASISALLAFPTETAYCATKAAVASLTRSTALDLAEDGIRCNCYCPTSIETDMLSPAYAPEVDPEQTTRELAASHLVHRLGRPEDVAKLVCFLASDDACFINGSAYLIDGGALAWRGLHR
jgi:NAD(P)-dependent dehydrogenase (short-subunit alcohol dehydrogenase family)